MKKRFRKRRQEEEEKVEERKRKIREVKRVNGRAGKTSSVTALDISICSHDYQSLDPQKPA